MRLAVVVAVALLMSVPVAIAVQQESRLTAAADLAPLDLAGWATAADRDFAFVGVPGDDGPAGSAAGRVEVYQTGLTGWRYVATIRAHDGGPGHGFGRSIAADGGLIMIGAPGHDDMQGKVYTYVLYPEIVFTPTPPFLSLVWNTQLLQEFVGSSPGDEFGFDVDVSPTAAAVGAPGDSFRGPDAGRVYRYERTGLALAPMGSAVGFPWLEMQLEGDRLGHSVAVSEAADPPFVVAGAPYMASLYQGFGEFGGAWVMREDAFDGSYGEILQQKSDVEVGDLAGWDVAIWSDRMAALGAPGVDSIHFGVDSGELNMYSLLHQQTSGLTQNLFGTHGGQRLGHSVSIDGDRMVIGSPGFTDAELRQGSVRYYEGEEQNPDHVHWFAFFAEDVFPNDPRYNALYGWSTAIAGDHLIVGAVGHSQNGLLSGAAYANCIDC